MPCPALDSIECMHAWMMDGCETRKGGISRKVGPSLTLVVLLACLDFGRSGLYRPGHLWFLLPGCMRLPPLHGTTPTCHIALYSTSTSTIAKLSKDYDGDPETRESLVSCLFTSQSDRRIESWRRPPCTCSGCCTDPNHALSFPSFVALHRIQNPKRAGSDRARAGTRQACILSRIWRPARPACRHTASHTHRHGERRPRAVAIVARTQPAARTPSSLPACLPSWSWLLHTAGAR